MSRQSREGFLCILLCGVLVLSAPAMAGIVLFTAGSDQISSVGVLNIAQDPQGNLYFGTDNGLSFYDGIWHITHMTYGSPGTGLLSDHILALAFDSHRNLWIGYPNGLQRLEGGSFVTIQDQQMLKSLDIHALLRRDNEMWVAAGNAGIHRYLDGTWRWFQPGGPEGLGCNYVTAMATDPSDDTLYIGCREGIWFTGGAGGSVDFSPLVIPGFEPDSLRGIRGDPFGGVYIFNASAVLHYSQGAGVSMVVAPGDLMGIDITDLGIDPDGTLWISTNYGIYAWEGGVKDHLDAASGIRNNGVKKIFIDSSDRLWFVTPQNVGFFNITRKADTSGSVIPITLYPRLTTPESTPAPQNTPALSFSEIQVPTAPAESGPFADLLGSILRFLGQLLPR